MSVIRTQIDTQALPANAGLADQLSFIVDVLYRAINIACLRGVISFQTADAIQKIAEFMTRIAVNYKNNDIMNRVMFNNFTSSCDQLSNFVEQSRALGVYNIKDLVFIYRTCNTFKTSVVPMVNELITEQERKAAEEKRAAEKKASEEEEAEKKKAAEEAAKEKDDTTSKVVEVVEEPAEKKQVKFEENISEEVHSDEAALVKTKSDA